MLHFLPRLCYACATVFLVFGKIKYFLHFLFSRIVQCYVVNRHEGAWLVQCYVVNRHVVNQKFVEGAWLVQCYVNANIVANVTITNVAIVANIACCQMLLFMLC